MSNIFIDFRAVLPDVRDTKYNMTRYGRGYYSPAWEADACNAFKKEMKRQHKANKQVIQMSKYGNGSNVKVGDAYICCQSGKSFSISLYEVGIHHRINFAAIKTFEILPDSKMIIINGRVGYKCEN